MATLPDPAKSALLLEDKALHIHLTCLSLAMGEQTKWINSMFELHHNHERSGNNPWSDVLTSHGRLTACLSAYMKGKTPLTYMHVAVVSRLSEFYQHSVAAAELYYDDKKDEESVFRAKITRKSAKFLVYAMQADCAVDTVLRDWCLKAADALHSVYLRVYVKNYFVETGESHLNLYHKHTTKGKGALEKGQTLLASAHSFLARHFKMRAAAALFGKYTSQCDIYENYDVVRLSFEALLINAETLYLQEKTFAADTLVSIVLHHSCIIDDLRTDFSWDDISHIYNAVLSYASGIDVAVPDPYRSAFDADLLNLLWKRALSLPRSTFSEKLVEYAAKLKNSLVSLHSRAELCHRNAQAHTAAGHSTSADVWLHISSIATALPNEIIAAAVFLNASEDGADCEKWEIQQARINAVDEWIKFGDHLDVICGKLNLYRTHCDTCLQTCNQLPPRVRTLSAEMWEQAINILTNGLQQILTVVVVGGEYVYPRRDIPLIHWCDTMLSRARYCALAAAASVSETRRYMAAARSAQLVGAVEVAAKYTELAVITTGWIASKTLVVARADNTQIFYKNWEIFSTHETRMLNTIVTNLVTALKYFKSASENCFHTTVSKLWRDAYEQQLLVSECCMRGVATAAPDAAIQCILRHIELQSASSASPVLKAIQQLACQFAVSVTKPEGKNVMWLNLARSACEQACNLFSPYDNPDDGPKVARQISFATRLRCAAMCCGALADTSLTEKDTVEPLVLSTQLLALFRKDWGSTCEKISKFDVGISFLNDVAVAFLDGTPHAHLVETLRYSESITPEPLCEQVQTLVELNKGAQHCAAALVVAVADADGLGQRLWTEVGSKRLLLEELVYRQSLHLIDPTSPDVSHEYVRVKLQFERLQLAALSHDNGNVIISHCFEMASVINDIPNGRRQQDRHTRCTQRYLDIITSVAGDDPALTALKITAADCFRDLTDKNDNKRPENALFLYCESADARIDAYIAGQESQTEKQSKLLQVSDLLAEAAHKLETAAVTPGPQGVALSQEAKSLKDQADKFRASIVVESKKGKKTLKVPKNSLK